jgi:hypothetical protein
MECMLAEGAEHGHSSNTQPWDLEKTVTKKPRGRSGGKATLAAEMWAWFDGLGTEERSRLTMRDVVARYVGACVETRTPCDQRDCLALCNTVLAASTNPDVVVDAMMGVHPSVEVQVVVPTGAKGTVVEVVPPEEPTVEIPPEEPSDDTEVPPEPSVEYSEPPEPTGGTSARRETRTRAPLVAEIERMLLLGGNCEE